eukprot:gene13304-biopygen23036
MILYVTPRPKCRICDSLFYTAPPPPFPPNGRQEGRRRCPKTVVGKLDQPPVQSSPSARPGRAAGGGGRAARGADLRAGMRPGKSRKFPTPPPRRAPRHPSAHPPARAAHSWAIPPTVWPVAARFDSCGQSNEDDGGCAEGG